MLVLCPLLRRHNAQKRRRLQPLARLVLARQQNRLLPLDGRAFFPSPLKALLLRLREKARWDARVSNHQALLMFKLVLWVEEGEASWIAPGKCRVFLHLELVTLVDRVERVVGASARVAHERLLHLEKPTRALVQVPADANAGALVAALREAFLL